MSNVLELENVKIERDGGITFIILNRPEKRNAMSPQLHLDMNDALNWAAEDEQTKVVVLTGAGGNFCAGQDLKLYFRGTENDPILRNRARKASHSWRWDKLTTFPKATIAMVHGFEEPGIEFAVGGRLRHEKTQLLRWGHRPVFW